MLDTMSRICVWGDSIFKGVIYSPESKRHIYIKDSCIDLISHKYAFQVENYSKFGQTSEYALNKLKETLKDKNDYDYAIIELGGNDCDYLWKDISIEPNKDHQAKVPLQDYIHNIDSIVSLLRQYSIIPIIVTLPPIDANRYYQYVSNGLNAENIHIWLKDIEHIYRVQEMYSLALTKYAYSNNINVLDLRGALLAEDNYYQYVCQDGIHLNEYGHHKIYELFVNYISNLTQS